MKKRDIFAAVLMVILIIISCSGCAMTLTISFDSDKDSAEQEANSSDSWESWEGTIITYEIKNEDFTSDELSDTINKLQWRVYEYSADAVVYQEDTDRIIVEIPDVLLSDVDAEELGCTGLLQFVTYDSYDEDGNIDFDSPTVWFENDDFESATAGTQTTPLRALRNTL